MMLLYSLLGIMILIAYTFVWQNPLNKTVYLSMLFIGVFSIGLYRYAGNAPAYQAYLYVQEVNHLIIELQHYLEKHPDDHKGWYLLGRLYLNQNQKDKAAQAFEKAQTVPYV